MEVIKKVQEELEKEVLKLRNLKDKGRFNLQQSEYSLQRLAGSISTIFIKYQGGKE